MLMEERRTRAGGAAVADASLLAAHNVTQATRISWLAAANPPAQRLRSSNPFGTHVRVRDYTADG